jgi:ectoine hydroxylase-related dioxygenase (phytanoyl-CoA dioxygenase family)
VSDQEAEQLRHWNEHGYLVLREAIEPELIDALLAEYDRGWRERPARVRMLVEGQGEQLWPQVAPRETLTHHHYRVMNFHEWSEQARRIMLHERLVRPLSLILGDDLVGMQSLLFEYSSEQQVHQDYAYVASQTLSHLAASWVACEDVSPANGTLYYLPGSHRIPKFDWGGGQLYIDATRVERVPDFEAHIRRECERRGLQALKLEGRKGDVFLWHAALAHGGSEPTDRSRTRLSYVCHYATRRACPTRREAPHEEPRRYRLNGAECYLPPEA